MLGPWTWGFRAVTVLVADLSMGEPAFLRWWHDLDCRESDAVLDMLGAHVRFAVPPADMESPDSVLLLRKCLLPIHRRDHFFRVLAFSARSGSRRSTRVRRQRGSAQCLSA